MWNKLRNTRGFYIAISIFCAIFCWLFVDVTQEPKTSRTIRDIPVHLTGTDSLSRQSLMVADEESPTLTLTFTGVRTEVSRLNRGNIYLSADLSGCKEGAQELKYSISYDPALSVASIRVQGKTNVVPVNIVKVKSKTIRVEGVLNGALGTLYRFDADSFSCAPSRVTVTGPAAQVQQVDHAQVILDQSGLTDTWRGELETVLVDQQGNPLELPALECSPDSVNATFPISARQRVDLAVTLNEGGGITAEDVEWSVSPESIEVAGTRASLSALNQNRFSVGTVNLSEVITSVQKSFPIELPDGLTNLSGSQSATVTVKVNSSLAIRKVRIPASRIRLLGKPRHTNVEILSGDIEVRIRGSASDMALLLEKDVQAEVDLRDVEEGTIGALTLPARIWVQGMSGLGPIDEVEVKMDLREE